MLTFFILSVNTYPVVNTVINGGKIDNSITIGYPLVFLFCSILIYIFTRKSELVFQSKTRSVEYNIEYTFSKKTGEVSFDNIKKVIVKEGSNSDGAITQKLYLITSKGKIPLSLTSDNTTDYDGIAEKINTWLEKHR